MTDVIVYGLLGLVVAYMIWSSRRMEARHNARRPSYERMARIAFLATVAGMPMGVSCDRQKAEIELEELLAEEGFG